MSRLGTRTLLHYLSKTRQKVWLNMIAKRLYVTCYITRTYFMRFYVEGLIAEYNFGIYTIRFNNVRFKFFSTRHWCMDYTIIPVNIRIKFTNMGTENLRTVVLKDNHFHRVPIRAYSALKKLVAMWQKPLGLWTIIRDFCHVDVKYGLSRSIVQQLIPVVVVPPAFDEIEINM